MTFIKSLYRRYPQLPWILFLLACVAAMSVWFVHIEADTDAFLTWDGSLYADEAWNADNALTHYFGGGWQNDGYHNFILLMPVMPLIQYVFFKVLGVSLITLRLPAILLSLAVLAALLYFIKKRNENLYLTLFLFAFNYELFGWARAGRIEMPMLAGCLLVMVLVYQTLFNKTKSTNNLILIGIALATALAMLTRPTSLVILASLGVWFGMLWWNKTKIKNLPQVGAALGGGLILYFILLKSVPWVLGFSQHSAAMDVVKGNIILKPEYLLNYFKFFSNSLIQSNLGLFVLSLFQAGLIFWNTWKRKKVNALDQLFAAFFIIFTLFVGYYDYMPPRWVIPVLIPMFYLLTTLPAQFSKHKTWILVAILVLNLPNVARTAYYFTDLKYTKRDVAYAIERDIQKDLGRKDLHGIILYGTHSSTFSVTNHMPFAYEIPNQPGKYVVIHGTEALKPGQRVRLLKQYDMLYNFGDMKIHLYKTY